MTLTHEDRKSTLWDAANTLRGFAVDRTDWKGYILPLLFFKRTSPVHDPAPKPRIRPLGFASATRRA